MYYTYTLPATSSVDINRAQVPTSVDIRRSCISRRKVAKALHYALDPVI